MNAINFKKEVNGDLDEIIHRVAEGLKGEGFGILNRIYFNSKIKEKIGKDLPPTVILGDCNPDLAYEAFLQNSDVTGLLPWNLVVCELGEHRISVELAKPSSMMEIIGD